MQTFHYQLQAPTGETTSGAVQAPSLREAAVQARARGGTLLHIAPLSAQAQGVKGVLDKLRSVNIQRGPSLKDVQAFTNQLAVMIKAGINIRSALEGIASNVENVKFRKMIQQVRGDVEAGQQLSAALARHPKAFSGLYVNMVRASELSGSLGHMLERITAYLSQQVETRNMIRGAMVYPAIIGVMAVVTTVFLLTFVLPKFTTLFAGKAALLPKPTLVLIGLSGIMRSYWYAILGAIVLLVGLLIYAIRTPVGQVYWDAFKLRVPLLKRMLRALYITRGMHTMGELISAGVPMLETLAITAEISGNALYKRMWDSVHNSVKEGNKIAHPLSRQKLLPSNVVQMISSGEESGKLGEVLRDIADFYSRELRDTIKTVTAMIEPIMIVVMGAVVGFIAMSVILPIFKMSSLVK